MKNDMITFNCASCGQHLEAAQELSGSKIQCPACKKLIIIPSNCGNSQPPSLPYTKAKNNKLIPITIAGLCLMLIIMMGSILYLSLMLSLKARQLDDLSQQIDKFKNQDSYSYVKAGKLLDSGDLSQAGKAYQLFIRDFPDSSLIPHARKTLEEISTRLSILEKEQAKQVEQDRQKEALSDLAIKVKYKALTWKEWSTVLPGKTKREINDLLGHPFITYNSDNEWAYSSKVLYPDSGHRGDLHIHFVDGVVSRYDDK